MRTLNYILLAVADPAKSAAFYTDLLGIEPVENSPTFVMFVLPNGIKLGLWLSTNIEPTPKSAGGVEITFSEDTRDAVQASYDEWSGKAHILQEPVELDFGFTFVAEDLDGHRLRVFTPARNPR